MAAPLRSFLLNINNLHITPVPSGCLNLFQKRWRKRPLIYQVDGAHHVPGIPVHPDKKFPKVDPNDLSEEAEYPPIKPKFPSGHWDSITRENAWLWHSIKEEAAKMETRDERINIFQNKKANMVVLGPNNEHPATLDFRGYVTKTHLIPCQSLPLKTDINKEQVTDDDSNRLDLLIGKVKAAVEDHLLLENEILIKESSLLNQNTKCRALFRCISDSIINFFQHDFEHLQLCQYDEDVLVRSFWHRFAVGQDLPRASSLITDYQFRLRDPEPDKINNDGRFEYSDLDEMIQIISEMNETVVSEFVFDAMIRSHLPLPSIEDRDSQLSNTAIPSLDYKLSSYGHKHTRYTNIGEMSAGFSRGRRYQAPAAGDPCEFGLVGFLSTVETNELERKYNLSVAENARLALGLTSAFTWLSAQAMNQGFSDLVDLTYPLVSQAILSDGQKFSFLQYQLNTLGLWQEDTAYTTANLCWHTKETPLYHSLEDGQVKGLNDDVLKAIVDMFLCSPQARGYDLKATLTDTETKTDFVPEKVIIEEVIEEEKYII